MARLIFDNLTTEQAKTFANWFEGQGEQSCAVWFDEDGVKSPLVDVTKKYEQCNDDLIVYCYTPGD